MIADSQHGWLPLPHVDGRKWLRDDDPSHHFRESESKREKGREDGEHRAVERDVENWQIFTGCLNTPWASRQSIGYK